MKNISFLFYGSIFLGIFIWFFFFIVTPIEVKNKVSAFTILFISLSYISLILGFRFASTISSRRLNSLRLFSKLEEKRYLILKVLVGLVLLSFLLRYFDLFNNRGVKFANAIHINKYNAAKPENFSLLFAFLSAFRVLFFVPLIFYFANSTNKKKTLFICVFLFLLPFLEAYLRGSRRLVFESLGILTIILLIFNKINFKSFKTLIILISIIIVLFSFSLSVLKSRISDNNTQFYYEIFNSQYNELTPAKEEAIKFIQNNNNILGKAFFSEIHLGQYITHGVFEMDYMISTHPKHMYGKFNFYSFVKFLNKLGMSNIPLSSINNPTKRITYITFFGGMFLDFGWFAIPLMFLFGIFQQKLLSSSKHNFILIPLSILFIFSNIFMLIFNFIRTQFLFSFTIYLVFICIVFLVFKRKNNNLFCKTNNFCL